MGNCTAWGWDCNKEFYHHVWKIFWPLCNRNYFYMIINLHLLQLHSFGLALSWTQSLQGQWSLLLDMCRTTGQEIIISCGCHSWYNNNLNMHIGHTSEILHIIYSVCVGSSHISSLAVIVVSWPVVLQHVLDDVASGPAGKHQLAMLVAHILRLWSEKQ